MTLADPPAGLSARLRTGTRSEHDRAQGSGFLDRLAAGALPRAAYADLAAQHWFIYETLERAAAAMADHPVAGAFVFPELTRLPALTEDLTVLAGRAPRPSDADGSPATGRALRPASDDGLSAAGRASHPARDDGLSAAGPAGRPARDDGLVGDGRASRPGDDDGLAGDGGQPGDLGLPGDGAELVPLAATREYRARLHAVAFDKPWAFIAHHYTRYLGDLSGGQYLGPAIARAYGLDGAGHRFFVFEGYRRPSSGGGIASCSTPRSCRRRMRSCCSPRWWRRTGSISPCWPN
ncbi:hypothetical protein Asp14428_39290 [Actinoplanes sp. NBRC 14428]|nr:hypothetical protein Asp14428_39290 [Actinoplanes sp. NBRC 14428]